MRFHRLAFLMIVCTTVCHTFAAPAKEPAASPKAEEGVFQRMGGPFPVTSFAVSEDFRWLVTAHEEADAVCVWDVVTGKLVTKIETDRPTFVLCRGDNAYVANYDDGTITVLSSKPKWEKSSVVPTVRRVVFMSAPAGKNFENAILCTAVTDTFVHVYDVNLKTKEAKDVRKRKDLMGAVVDASGKRVLEVIGNSTKWEDYDLGAYRAGDVTKVIHEYPDGELPLPWPGGRYWYSSRQLYAGMPPKPFLPYGQQEDNPLVDLTRPLFYRTAGDRLRAFALDESLKEIGSTPMPQPAKPASWNDRILPIAPFCSNPGELGCRIRFPIAFTLGERLYIFAAPSGELLRGEFPAFKDPDKAATRPAAPVAANAFPTEVVAGTPLVFQIPGVAADSRHELMDGPEGLTVSAGGGIRWKPSAQQVGMQTVKVRVEASGAVRFERFTTKVVGTKDDLNGGDLTRGIHYFVQDDMRLSLTEASDGIMILDDTQLRTLDADGMKVTRTVSLPTRYQRIFDRKDHWVGITARAVEIVDKQSLRIKGHFDIPCEQVVDADVHPSKNSVFVATYIAQAPLKAELRQTYEVDENSGKVQPVTGVYAQRLAFHPGGRYAYVVTPDAGFTSQLYKDFDSRGMTQHESNVHRSQGLTCYDTSVTPWRNVSWNPGVLEIPRKVPEGSIAKLVPSPAGNLLAVLSTRGLLRPPTPAGQPPRVQLAFAQTEMERAAVTFEVDEAYDIAFHPSMNLVAIAHNKGLNLFDSKTGALVERRVDFKGSAPQSVSQVRFSAGGRHLLVAFIGADGRRRVQSFPLQLSAEELQVANAPGRPKVAPVDPPAVPAPGKPGALKREELQALAPAPAAGGAPPAELSPKQIAARFSDAVVLVNSKEGFGTGFVVGRGGYILTCAHVLPRAGQIEISFKPAPAADGKPATALTAAGNVIGVNEKEDLALLRIETERPLTVVRLADGVPEVGERTVVIGNPGQGRLVLDQTVSTGILSSSNREINGLRFLQISAAVNPGNSGGPAFDEQGNVLGIVVMKANLRAVGMVIPSSRARTFLETFVAPPAK
jgi:WD40 repeat protein